MRTRTYGTSGPGVIVLHGGPGAPGSMAPVAGELAESFRVIEPFQRFSREGEPLTVASHVADLRELVQSGCAGTRPALVGSSWGAMLALAYAAAHPGHAGPLILIGCGTFDPVARSSWRSTLDTRMDDRLRKRLGALEKEIADPDARLRMMGELIEPLYCFDLIATDSDAEPCDARGHRETWDDMIRLQDEGVYPSAFGAIDSPVLMLHGVFDPHPGAMIRDGLKPYLPHLEYIEWERCGHYPWREKTVRDTFFSVLREWLARHADAGEDLRNARSGR